MGLAFFNNSVGWTGNKYVFSLWYEWAGVEMFPINDKAPVNTEAFVAGSIEISNLKLIQDLSKLVDYVDNIDIV